MIKTIIRIYLALFLLALPLASLAYTYESTNSVTIYSQGNDADKTAPDSDSVPGDPEPDPDPDPDLGG